MGCRVERDNLEFYAMHHYVLVNFSEVYDIAAAGWRVEQLPDREKEPAGE